ncbi:MAG: SAM-dependent chlorinase/fluorinase [Deltaproteobacteria bacterium]|nr:SAM-dependent chlorinase/fluorinase [Deltaproteobacteria bacterium]
MGKGRIITLLTDFGTEDSYVGAMKGVVFSINPNATIIDISHQIPPQDIMAGAFVLSHAAPFFPQDTIHVAVVDPGVGGERKPILVETERYFFVGPDNGIFSIALKGEKIKKRIILSNKEYFYDRGERPFAPTFHGRDIFSPVAAYLSLGIEPSLFGEKIKAVKSLDFKKPYVRIGKIIGQIIHIDRFGNLITNIDEGLLKRIFKNKSFEIRIGSCIIKKLVPSYTHAKQGESIGLIGSSGFLEIAMREKNASAEMGIKRGDRAEVR